jgi:hypothetical protein
MTKIEFSSRRNRYGYKPGGAICIQTGCMRTPRIFPIFALKRHAVRGLLAVVLFSAAAGSCALAAQTNEPQRSDPAADHALRVAMESELRAEKADKSVWKYVDTTEEAGKRTTFHAIETPQGELRRAMSVNGKPLAGEAEQKERDRIRRFVNDPDAQARARKSDAHDDAQAEAFLKMLPDAFLWTPAGETAETVTLRYRPNPNFRPPSLEARVLAVMAGEMVIARQGNRIQSLSGKLTQDVKFLWGMVGKMDEGGTFDVERRQVAPGHWAITENHVHIGGHALFKNIGQNSDEVKTEWEPSEDRTLAAAAHELGVE